METRIGVSTARRRLGWLVKRVSSGEHVIVERSGKPLAAIVPIQVYECWLRERERSFEAFDRMRRNLPDTEFSEEEVEADTLAAVKEVRAAMALERQQELEAQKSSGVVS
jgi:prevent-host-death family protein